MNRLTQTGDFENPLDSMIDAFFHTFEKRVNVFIVDDTLYERNRSKHVELLSWVLDHTKNKFVKGFRLL
ncbi:MAG: transposase, partial [Synergistaceae bacterium]|nr:transposase [Synergistaceae bacterium]